MRTTAAIIAASLWIISGQTVNAACTQSEVAGVWQAYSINSEVYWVRCRISVNSVGTIANNTCISSIGTSASMTNGRIRLSAGSTCTYTGSFSLGGLAHAIRHATMSKDKISVQGVGTYSGGSFNFNLTKQ